jgi:hypothetical protein
LSGSSAAQSARGGTNTSMTTAPSGPAVASCGVFAGIVHVPPAPGDDSVPDRERRDSL